MTFYPFTGLVAAVFCAVLLPSNLPAQELQTPAERFQAAFLPLETKFAEVETVTADVSYEGRVHQAFDTLIASPDSALDLEALRRMAVDNLEKDPELRAYAYAGIAVSAAQKGRDADYLALVEAFQTVFPGHTLLTRMNPDALTRICPSCNGKNIRTVRCDVCKNTGRCPSCSGSGRAFQRATLGGGSGRERTMGIQTGRPPCAACDGTGKCPECATTRVACRACGNSGLAPDKDKIAATFTALMKEGKALAFKRIEPEHAEKNTNDEFRRAVEQVQRTDDPEKAISVLVSFIERHPALPLAAAARETVKNLQTEAETRAYQSPKRVALRKNVEEVIFRAQSDSNVENGLDRLISARERYSEADNATEIDVAIELLTQKKEQLLADGRAALQRIAEMPDTEAALLLLAPLLQPGTPGEIRETAKILENNLQKKLSTEKKRRYITIGVAVFVFLFLIGVAVSIYDRMAEKKRKRRVAGMTLPFSMPPPDSDPFDPKNRS